MIDMEKMLKQFRKWAKGLLKVNPDYVRDPRRLLSYIKGPNWDHSDVEYAQYRNTVAMYGEELLYEFERLRGLPVEDAVTEYEALIRDARIEV